MAYRGTDNLGCYVREAVLPKMLPASSAPSIPTPGHKSHLNTLHICPEPYRKLETIFHFVAPAFDEAVTTWADGHLPEYPLEAEDGDEITGEQLSVPCPYLSSIPSPRLTRPSDVIRLSQWFDNLPLQTAQRAMHLAYPQTEDWAFSFDNEDDMDNPLFRHFFWTRHQDDHHDQDGGDGDDGDDGDRPANPNISRFSLVLAIQTPWVLSPHDLDRFVGCKSFPSFNSQRRLHSKERLWGKLWDLCVRKNCPWFVLSTYHGWCFGAFSAGWSRAFVSSVYPFDNFGPTILEVLLFWLASAMALPGSWRVPEVPEPVLNLAPYFLIPPPHNDRLNIVPSESSWAGKSDEPASSAGVERSLSPVLSNKGLSERSFPLQVPQPQPRRDAIRKVLEWTQSIVPSDPLPPYEFPPSPTPSDASTISSSTSTIVDATTMKYTGEWLVIPAMELAPDFPYLPSPEVYPWQI